jgi:hypothetical protein
VGRKPVTSGKLSLRLRHLPAMIRRLLPGLLMVFFMRGFCCLKAPGLLIYSAMAEFLFMERGKW